MAKIPAGYVEALWVGPHEATTSERPVYAPGCKDTDPPVGELPAQLLIPGETTAIVSAGEADTSDNWKVTAVKGGQAPKTAPAPHVDTPGGGD